LILHHTWIGNVDSFNIDDIYATAFKVFLWTPHGPKLISMAILQKELGWKSNKSADLSMSLDHNGDTGALREYSHITQGSNHQEVIEAAEEADTECNYDLGGVYLATYPMEALPMCGTTTTTQPLRAP
jgi:hypothetical protein